MTINTHLEQATAALDAAAGVLSDPTNSAKFDNATALALLGIGRALVALSEDVAALASKP